jgi:hypothetical protein
MGNNYRGKDDSSYSKPKRAQLAYKVSLALVIESMLVDDGGSMPMETVNKMLKTCSSYVLS